jgi:hypothetical protein
MKQLQNSKKDVTLASAFAGMNPNMVPVVLEKLDSGFRKHDDLELLQLAFINSFTQLVKT